VCGEKDQRAEVGRTKDNDSKGIEFTAKDIGAQARKHAKAFSGAKDGSAQDRRARGRFTIGTEKAGAPAVPSESCGHCRAWSGRGGRSGRYRAAPMDVGRR
jgi:hypothetical protein